MKNVLKKTDLQRLQARVRYEILWIEAAEPYAGGEKDCLLYTSFLSMDMAQNILVVKTVSGMAMAVAAALDALNWQEVVGCIAGDDTVFCAVRTADDAVLVMEKLRRALNGGGKRN